MGRATTPPQNRRIVVTKSPIKGLLAFEPFNLFPQILAEIVRTSVTASRCYATRAAFIEGNGFRDTLLSKRVVYRTGLTLDRVLSQTAKNVSMYNVICLHVSYNGLAQIVGIRPVGVELIRLGEEDADGIIRRAGICNWLGSTRFKNKQKDYTPLTLFNPDRAVVLEEIRAAGGINGYNGQLIYHYIPETGDEAYHEPDYLSCIKDMETEAGLSLFDFATVQNGFNLSGVFGYMGSEKEDPLNDQTSIEYQMMQLQGPTKAGAIMTLRANTKEELQAMTFVPTTGAELKNRYDSTTERVEHRICRAWGMPPPLVGITRANSLLPTPDELKTASRYAQFLINPYQRMIQEVFESVFTHWAPSNAPAVTDYKIQNLDYFDKTDATSAG